MKKLVQVHMLPKEKINAPNYKKLGICDGLLYQNGYRQHLYFTSDEEIKEGDRVYCDNGNIAQITPAFWSFRGKSVYRKIVATTDKSLSIKMEQAGDNVWVQQLPQVPQAFIEKYVKAGGIDEVLLEYKDWCDYDDDNTWGGFDEADLRLVLDQNNCVIIHPVEPKLYTKEELITILEGFIEHPTKPGYKRRDIENWIKENL